MAGPWKVFARAKRKIGNGTISLAGVMRMSLHKASASAALLSISTLSLKASVPGEVTGGGYPAGGKLVPNVKWTVGRSGKEMKFSYTTAGLVFTANGSSIPNIKYALIRNSTGAGAGHVVAFCTLSATPITLTSPNTLSILPHADGAFYMV